MTVKELIKQLRKLNPEAAVVMQDHDQGEDESNGTVLFVEESDSEVLRDKFGGAVVTIR
ncbi:hypothetical protein [Pseudomonas sp. PARCl1]|uniref:hypothetical protein n=1 Tax=Pseudomonas sp. PARCl1 TaxID=2853444 RepID=UPI001C748101|nr:hypothetical protein [Pseudomonas sp. PARCl1]QXM18692.1 hypothetical protein [Pseudomonas phage PARCL1pr]